MNFLKFDNPGVLHAYQETLALMQSTYRPMITALTKMIGDNVIVEGCEIVGTSVSSGTIIMGGEVLPFEGGNISSDFRVKIKETIGNAQYNDGQQRPFSYERKAVISTTEGVLFSDFSNIKKLKDFRTLPTKHSSDYSASDANLLATIKAVYDLKQELEARVPKGVIVMWSGNLYNVPVGFALCDGNNGTPDLRNRFIVGAGDLYSVNDKGGAEKVQLSLSEMPKHSHSYTYVNGSNKQFSNTGSSFFVAIDTLKAPYDSGTAGGDLAHENRPPYYALAYIMKL